MSRGQTNLERAVLLRQLGEESGRKAAMAILLLYSRVADRLGLSLTDLFCGEILARTGPLTAGELADLAGLTTGAITGVVDRLEKGGYVRRENDPHDRRRVMVRALPETWAKKGAPLYQALNRRLDAVHAAYSDQELAVIADYLNQLSEVYDEEAAQLARHTPEPVPHSQRAALDARVRMDVRIKPRVELKIGRDVRETSAPLREVKHGRLEWSSGVVTLALVAAEPGELYHARFERETPLVRVEDGVVSLQYRQSRLFGRSGGKAQVGLNPRVPWELDLHANASVITADLAAVSLERFNLASNASKLDLVLPQPRETVTVRLAMNGSEITLRRPKDIPLRIECEGAGSQVILDKHKVSMTGNESLETPGYKRATARYVIQFAGSSSKLNVQGE